MNETPLKTTADGIDTPALEDGAYIIVENKEASTYTGTDGEAITDSKAIPTRIELPMTKPDGSGLFDTTDKLHIYPKNTEEKPQIDKNFAKEGTEDAPGVENAGANYENYQKEKETINRMVGDSVPYEVKTKIPAKSEFKTVRWEDTMTKGLTFNKDLKILLDGQEFASSNYTLVQNESGFTLTLNDTGYAALKTAAATKDVEFTLTYTATINDSAVVDNPDGNNIKFDYSNKPNEFKDPRENEVKPQNKRISVTKNWADGEAPEGIVVKYYLYEKATETANDKVVDSVELKGPDYNYTFKDLDDAKTYYVKEIVSGYKPEYKVGAGSVEVTNTKDNENPTPLDPTEPKVETYGKKFVKADETSGARLSGAVFLIKNEEGKFLALKDTAQQEKTAYEVAKNKYNDAIAAWNKAVAEKGETADEAIEVQIGEEKITGKTAVEAKIEELKTARDNAFKAMNTQWTWATKDEAFEFTSNEKGQFEVTGLAAGTYTVVEIKAPAGYALPSNPDIATFEAKKGSYTEETGVKYEGTEVVEGTTGDAQRLNNKKVSIPQTGGIGTIIFGALGIALMAGAVVAMKRSC